MNLENISSNRCFGGWHKQYLHDSAVLACRMRFAIYLPPQAAQGDKVPVLYWLSGLTCTDENFMQKAGAQRLAAELGMVVNAGHGLNYHNVKPIAAIPQITELNIGHAIIGQAVFVGLDRAVRDMKALMMEARQA